jgi:RNA polymerase sigma-70 factor (ECF subfamily)
MGDLDPADDDPGEVIGRIQAYLEQIASHGVPQPSDLEEWETFFRQYSPSLWRLVRSRHWSREDSDDGNQEVWLMLITRLPDLHYDASRGQPRDWIRAAAKHRLVDQHRRRRSHFAQRLGGQAASQLKSREPDPAVAFERQRLVELVRDALDELRSQVAQRDYDAFTLKWLEGRSVREVARLLGMTEAQIWSSHHRTSERLRPLLTRRLNRSSNL